MHHEFASSGDDGYWEWLIQLRLACERLVAAEREAEGDLSRLVDVHHALEVITDLMGTAHAIGDSWAGWRDGARHLLSASPRAGEILRAHDEPELDLGP